MSLPAHSPSIRRGFKSLTLAFVPPCCSLSQRGLGVSSLTLSSGPPFIAVVLLAEAISIWSLTLCSIHVIAENDVFCVTVTLKGLLFYNPFSSFLPSLLLFPSSSSLSSYLGCNVCDRNNGQNFYVQGSLKPSCSREGTDTFLFSASQVAK